MLDNVTRRSRNTVPLYGEYAITMRILERNFVVGEYVNVNVENTILAGSMIFIHETPI